MTEIRDQRPVEATIDPPGRGEEWMVADVGAVPGPGDRARGFEEWARHWHTGNEWWS
ncbi:hypothetical protein H9Y04_19510 [Streptomyces sp. TRM66268-LWL]|uniref:Uncharacterized protein n=1 Tax=Streptomyces polyasparticus TaxID=2767826 RepID=A0ABR7SJ66_9ACTN|nr:hypothetical protein [Streptomyces polyasparticus]MBC9714745.1 hypothetical protein [Streptomyces polyasparticus]